MPDNAESASEQPAPTSIPVAERDHVSRWEYLGHDPVTEPEGR